MKDENNTLAAAEDFMDGLLTAEEAKDLGLDGSGGGLVVRIRRGVVELLLDLLHEWLLLVLRHRSLLFSARTNTGTNEGWENENKLWTQPLRNGGLYMGMMTGDEIWTVGFETGFGCRASWIGVKKAAWLGWSWRPLSVVTATRFRKGRVLLLAAPWENSEINLPTTTGTLKYTSSCSFLSKKKKKLVLLHNLIKN